MKKWILGILAVILIVCAAGAIWLSTIYHRAEAYIAQEEYEQAQTTLESIRKIGYKDTEALISLCEAHLQYDAGEVGLAYGTIRFVQFEHQSREQREAIDSFAKMLKEKYRAKQDALEQQRLEEQITSGVPFVGMPEKRIKDTVLGEPSAIVRHNTEMSGGKVYTANLYDFYRDGRYIFTARCIGGKVTEVFDYRYEQTACDPQKSEGKTHVTPPSVEDFTNPEDFYDWYYDDFFDYEQAQDYYYANGGQ